MSGMNPMGRGAISARPEPKRAPPSAMLQRNERHRNVAVSVRCLTPKQVRQMLGGIGQTTLYRWIKDLEGFPQPFKLGQRATRFWEEELFRFCDARAAKSRL